MKATVTITRCGAVTLAVEAYTAQCERELGDAEAAPAAVLAA